MVVIMLAGVMFPLWPSIMRLGVWYLSVAMLGVIGLFFALAIVRLIFYVITVIVASPGIWIFPQLFADVGFVSCDNSYNWFLLLSFLKVESFIPLWEWDLPKKRTKKNKDKKEKSDKGKEMENNALVSVEDVDSESSRPHSRSARIEDAEDE